MSNKWIGAALSLALCSTALVSCSARDDSSSNATGQTAGIAVDWNGKTERQLRDAIAEAPANGLKPELFLKGGESGGSMQERAAIEAVGLAGRRLSHQSTGCGFGPRVCSLDQHRRLLKPDSD